MFNLSAPPAIHFSRASCIFFVLEPSFITYKLRFIVRKCLAIITNIEFPEVPLARFAILCLACVALTAQAQTSLVDPTKPLNFSGAAPGTAASAEEGIKLTSILISSDRKLAIINGQVLQENQTLKGVGALVKKIDANAVTLQQNGKVWRVPLNSTTIRK